MTTIVRNLFECGIYHVYNRGHNQMTLFYDNNDFLFYLKCIKYCQEKFGFEIYALCLMTNHYHLLLRDVGKNLPLIMDTINSVYARYFNEKYNHKGSVFDGPFESNLIRDDYGFTKVYRYIIRNPVAAGMTYSIYEYTWATPNKERDIFGLINFKYVDEVFKKVCNIGYVEYLKSAEDDLWVEDIEIHKMEDTVAEELFKKMLFKFTATVEFNINTIDKETQKLVIGLASHRMITLSQLKNITGLSINKIRKLKENI